MFSIPNVPDRLAREIYAELCGTLPPPSPDTPEALTIRDERAMAAVAALIPENHFEAELATKIVAQVFHAKHALRDASGPNLTVDARNNYRNQASRTDRDSQSGVRTCSASRPSVTRPRTPPALPPWSAPATGTRTAWRWPAAPSPCSKRNRPTTRRRPANRPAACSSQMDPAEQDPLPYPQRAALIRAFGGLPPNINFGAPEPDLVAAIVASTSPIMLAIGRRRSPRAPASHPARRNPTKQTRETPMIPRRPQRSPAPRRKTVRTGNPEVGCQVADPKRFSNGVASVSPAHFNDRACVGGRVSRGGAFPAGFERAPNSRDFTVSRNRSSTWYRPGIRKMPNTDAASMPKKQTSQRRPASPAGAA